MTDGSIDHYRKVVATDLDSTYYCAHAAALHWRRQKKEGTGVDGKKLENFTYGSFVATASMSGKIVNIPQLQAAYNAAKAGIIHLCKLLPPKRLFRTVVDDCGDRPFSCRRVGPVRSRQHCLPWLHGHRNLRLRTQGDQGHVEGQDSYGVSAP